MRYRSYILLLIILCSLLLPYSAGAVQYTYDLNGNRITMTDPTGTTYYEYDALNRLTSITNPNGEVTTYIYDAVGRRTSTTLPNGIVTTYTYDAASRLTSLTHELNGVTIASFSYTYDKAGNRISMTDEYGTHTYTYDNRYQLTQATHPNQLIETYSYDAVGNRFGHVYNAANQLLEDTDFTYSYSKNGNTTQKANKATGEVVKYHWNTENQLVKIEKYTNDTETTPYSTIAYIYATLAKRVAKNVDGMVTKYVYDGEDILLETDENDNIAARYTHGPGIDEPLIVERNGQSYYYLTDGLGSVVKLVDVAGNVINSYVYDSFGNIVNKTEGIPNPYTYTAREYDAESGLYFCRTRYYDPQAGRFITEDPSHYPQCQNTNIPYLLPHLLKTPLELNPFLYVGNNPVNFTDPLGLLSKCKMKCLRDLFKSTLWSAAAGFGCHIGCAFTTPAIMPVCYSICFGLTGVPTVLYSVLYETVTCVKECERDDRRCNQPGG